MDVSELLGSPIFIAAVFFIIAALYSSVGLGGGSSYTAMMAILGFSVLAIPMISLTLNILATSVGSYNFIRNKHLRWRLLIPFIITSIPMSYYGGTLQLSKEVFYWVLLVSLCFVAARIYFWKATRIMHDMSETMTLLVSLLAGSVLGLVAGVAGIGGGVYLVPLIILLGLGTAKQAAACGVVFVWINSVVGVLSRLQYNPMEIGIFPYLVVAVVSGAMLGSYLGASRLSPRKMEKILGLIIIVAIFALGRKLFLI